MTKPIVNRVKCYSGHAFAQRPISFLWQGREYNVSEVEREWQEPGKKFFKVRTEDEEIFELCYNHSQDEWLIIELV